MRILFITSYPLEYNTSANVRNIGIVNGFINNGFEVTTLSPYPTNTSFYSGRLLDIPFKNRIWLGTQRIITPQSNTKSRPGKFKVFLDWLYSTISIYDRRSWLKRYINETTVNETYDILVSSSDPKSAHIIAERLLKVKPNICKKWIQYWGDPFTGDITINSSLTSLLIKKEERRLLGIADKSVYVSPFTAEEIKKTHPMYANKVQFLPIPYVELETNRNVPTCLLEDSYVSYLGNYTVSRRDIRPFVAAVNDLKIKTAIIGDSDIKIEEHDYLMVRDRMNSNDLQSVIDQTGVFVCVCNTHGTQIPGKIYHYVGSGKPILIILDGEYANELRNFFTSFGRFYLCNNNPDEIKNTLIQIRKEKKMFKVPNTLNPRLIARDFIK